MGKRLVWNTELILADMAKRGWTATMLAGKASLSVSTVSDFLAGRNRSIKTATKLAAALGRKSPEAYLAEVLPAEVA